jgi:hypothetical protein
MYNNSKNNPSSPCSGRPMRYDDSKAEGEYFTLDTWKWQKVETHWIDNNRIGVGRTFNGMEAKIFIFVGTEETIEKCKHYISYSRNDYLDLRKSRGEDRHKNIRISKEGTIWVGDEFYGNKIEVFIKHSKN